MNITKNEKSKWIAKVRIGRLLKISPPLRTKRAGVEWIETKKMEAILGDSDIRLMSAAIIKGLIERNDGTAYFGSTMLYTHHLQQAVAFGYVTAETAVTKRGTEWYQRCLKQLPQARQVFWGGVGLADQSIVD